MEPKNHKIANFLSIDERNEILDFVDSIPNHVSNINNVHIFAVSDMMNGRSYMFDITKTEISKYLSEYQSNYNNMNVEILPLFIRIMNRISTRLGIKSDSVFLQIIDQNSGGRIIPHYDSSCSGYINYKCNVSVLSEEYEIFIGKEKMNIYIHLNHHYIGTGPTNLKIGELY